ncbi:transcriptional regulator, TetR family [Kibdelosporangium aridum]|uniref:Transcriptional regulator, TetR family n=2 Tax=Kibdelosporangium aridum TaxID=2030 RepID=A0A1Y5Y2A2_KIBAR|nr:transcriptional regulator, TetR family [Kibdelosporangium aridum]
MRTATRQVVHRACSNSQMRSKTRDKVLKAGKDLFNEQSTAAVSIEDIAAAARVSASDLHAHFRDKQEIIRALFDEYIHALDGDWRPAKDPAKNIAMVVKNLAELNKMRWEYRFVNRELILLVRADSRIRAAYQATFERRFSELRVLVQQMVLQDLVRVPRLPRTIDDLLMNVWLISDSWFSHMELTGDPTDADHANRVNDVLMVSLEPYLTDQGRELFEKFAQ